MGVNRDVARGKRAQEILDDDVFADAVRAANEAFVFEWENAKTVDAREAAWYKKVALTAVLDRLQAIVGNGEYAQSEIERLERADRGASRSGP